MARGPRQTSIPGTQSSPENPELQELCEDVRLLRADRIAGQQKEKSSVEKLLAYRRTMTTPVEVYRYVDEDGIVRVARFTPVVKVSVRSEKSDDADNDDSDADNDDSEDSDGGGVDVQ